MGFVNMNDNSVRRKQRITALTLVMTLLLTGCNGKENSNNRYKIGINKDFEFFSIDETYIDNEYLSDYYVLEVYNKLSGKNEIYIVNNVDDKVSKGYYENIFNNLKFPVGFKDSVFGYVDKKKLSEYLVMYGLEKEEYSYDDMKYIYEVIKDNYVYERDDSLCKKRILNDRI